ncbi:hypothetical protein [Fibrivirga algicola]|uniref:Uncharacterized protein n=1 Tax=Fibrivirga algicola TaxID=2950420 RepID=A0ABX0QFD3_9BACT|nr:hypothetical protein [Fibrivirga algicola]ARK09821.1 hypothetical protein A6C57_05425 [Fibrella sp. ES10-3-2-2]NID10737.1 hypothetical protein [Fibrivirga algicola]
MTFEPNAHLLAFVLPMSFRKGDVTFSPTESGEDVQVPIPPTNRPRHVVSTAQLTRGWWKAIVNWSDGYQQYLEEKVIFVA